MNIFPSNILPSQAEIEQKITNSGCFVLTNKIPCDTITPVAALLKIKSQFPDYHFLFESVEKGANRGRYSAIALMPDLIYKCSENAAWINRDAEKNPQNFVKLTGHPLEELRQLFKESQITEELRQALPGLSSGLFGYMAYDMVRYMEKLPNRNLPDAINIPDSIFIRPQIIIIFDSLFDIATICAPFYDVTKNDLPAIYKNAENKISEIINLLRAQDFPESLGPLEKSVQKSQQNSVQNNSKNSFVPNFQSSSTSEQYCAVVSKAKEFIKDGDIFQILPSQRFTADFDERDSFAFYRSLRSVNPSPFLFYLQFPDFCFTGSSPEIMASVKNGVVTVRPLAGTRKRGADAVEDAKIADELLRDEKELAEHLMLIDLGRNDVGRVSEEGSVRVTEKMVVEYYSHVMHISSNVEGILRKGLDSIDALISAFPAGTVSGAPKIRAMEILEDLEKVKRSFYAGCVGYLAGNGDMETCISLRCALIKDGKIHLQSGGGVVFDSDPESEYQESLNKAKALIKAAENIALYRD